MTYTDVTWLELFSGWIVAGVLFVVTGGLIAKVFSLKKNLATSEWWRGLWERSFLKKQEFARSLEDKIARYTVRNRGK